TARTGDIVHLSSTNTWGGAYRAEAAGDVRFEEGAELNSESYEEYPEGWGSGPIDITAGGNIALTLGNAKPQAYNGALIQLNGRNVNIALPNGSLLNESHNLAHITADNLT